MSTTRIDLNNVTRVDWNNGEDNITQIRLKKGNKTTVIWNKPKLATFNVTLVRDNSFNTNTGWVIGRIGSYAGKSYVTPELTYGGFGYQAGGVYQVNIPNVVLRNASGARNEGFLKRSHNGGAAKPMLYYVSKVKNPDHPDGTTTRGDSGTIMSGTFLYWPTTNAPNRHTGAEVSSNLGFAQKYRFYQNVAQQTRLYDVRSNSFTVTGTAEDPTNVDLPEPVAAGDRDGGKQYRYSNTAVRSTDFYIPWEYYTSSQLQDYYAEQVDWGNVTGSDIRVKENIEFTGLSNSGLKIYEFDYIDKPGRYQGVMAQDLLEINSHHPAVVTDENGHYSVDYNYIDVEFKKIK